jgi:hypothetical protein
MPAKEADKKVPKQKVSRLSQRAIIEKIGNIPIRKVNYVSIYLDERAMKKIALILLKCPDLSVAKIIAISSKPCECCKQKKIQIAHGDKIILVPKGLLSCKKEKRGSNISTKKRIYDTQSPGQSTSAS